MTNNELMDTWQQLSLITANLLDHRQTLSNGSPYWHAIDRIVLKLAQAETDLGTLIDTTLETDAQCAS